MYILERFANAVRVGWRQLVITARLAVGVPDYATYLQHQQVQHPQQTPMSPEEFFHERMQARYARGRNRCC